MILLLDERQRKELAQYSPYIAIPKVSSQNRRYIPMDYLEGEIIPGDKLFTMPSATSYEFGILMSNVHMAWTRAVCGRLKSDYSYSNMIVYNNFPWPSPTNDQKEKITDFYLTQTPLQFMWGRVLPSCHPMREKYCFDNANRITEST